MNLHDRPSLLPSRLTNIGIHLALTRLLPLVVLATTSTMAMADNCQVQISNPVVNYGPVTRTQLLERQVSPMDISLGKHSVTLSATCKQATLMTMFFRATGEGNAYRFGNAGTFTLRLSQARLDGKTVNLGSVEAVGQPPVTPVSSALLRPGFGLAPMIDERQVKGLSFTATVEIDTRVLSTASRVPDRTEWRSTGTFELMEH